MSYALGASDLKFHEARVHRKTGHLRIAMLCDTWFPDHVLVAEIKVNSMAVDQESRNFDMAHFNMHGPVFYVRKDAYFSDDLEIDLDPDRYTLRLMTPGS